VNIQYGPIIVTAVDFGEGPAVRCPACFEQLPLGEGWLGQEIDCPRPGCEGRMRVNPFIVGPPGKRAVAAAARRSESERRPWWQFWQRG
jgi:hypothetical protein